LPRPEPKLAGPERFTVQNLKEIARAWMDDMHDYCNVSHSYSGLEPAQCDFMLRLRNFRRNRPWLRDNFRDDDYFDYLRPLAGRTVFAALRNGPAGEQVFCVVHMEGKATDEFDPLRLPVPGIEGFGWELALRTPDIGDNYIGGPITLRDSMGLVFTRAGGDG
jgi:hypothetical protein